ncbi:MAG: TIGR03915 family putative DNA repair protein [Clostridia bacterium]|nr:TIGR03915 family putative DNA repair protein [Clostridia bacterium]
MKFFITDGSVISFFTAVFDAFAEKECVITSDNQIQLSLDSQIIYVDGDTGKCERVRNGIAKYDPYAEEEILLSLRSCDTRKEQIAFDYIRKLMQIKAPIRKRLSLPEVIQLNDIVHKITYETHRFTGFLRFMECAGGILYAPYSPDNDITDLLMPHFAARLKSERFIIHDLKRKTAGIYNGSQWIMGCAGEAEVYLSENEKAFENLWKKYYKSVNIKERPHEKQMKGYMPVRYWKYLPEKN